MYLRTLCALCCHDAPPLLPSPEIPIYHILNARITFGNLNGCEDAAVASRAEAEPEGQKDGLRTDTPSPGSDCSSVSSSSSTSEMPIFLSVTQFLLIQFCFSGSNLGTMLLTACVYSISDTVKYMAPLFFFFL